MVSALITMFYLSLNFIFLVGPPDDVALDDDDVDDDEAADVQDFLLCPFSFKYLQDLFELLVLRSYRAKRIGEPSLSLPLSSS